MALSGLAVLPAANRGKITNIPHCGGGLAHFISQILKLSKLNPVAPFPL
jgi:hypothetical protein